MSDDLVAFLTDDLVAFLRARYNETAAKAHAAAAELGADWYYDDGHVLARREGDQVATGSQDYLERERGEHIARHDPARVLADIEAKRRMIDTFHRRYQASKPGMAEGAHWVMLADTLRLLALPYADHPDYREEWRP